MSNSLARIVFFLGSSFLHHKVMTRQIAPLLLWFVFLCAGQLKTVSPFKSYCEYELMVRIPKTVSQINVSSSLIFIFWCPNVIWRNSLLNYRIFGACKNAFSDASYFINSSTESDHSDDLGKQFNRL